MKSREDILRFGEFTLDPANRRLSRDGEPVELGGRYLDALIMLVRERGQLITKDRLHEEVWRGVPVTDEALSQAIMALRRALGDQATSPRYIETVPRHGYRFVGVVEGGVPLQIAQSAPRATTHETMLLIGGGIAGAAAAGLLVGLVYGSLAASDGAGSALSLVLVLICVSMLAALVSGLGIAGGIGLLTRGANQAWWRSVLGGGLGGLVVGGLGRLIGLDALRLLVGNAPDRITGAGEGLAIGLAVGLAFWLVRTRLTAPSLARHAIAPVIGVLAGAGIALAGGTLMAGSLVALVDSFPGASLALRSMLGGSWMVAAAAFEAAVFTALTVAGMLAARR